jgi:transposase-like protein
MGRMKRGSRVVTHWYDRHLSEVDDEERAAIVREVADGDTISVVAARHDLTYKRAWRVVQQSRGITT